MTSLAETTLAASEDPFRLNVTIPGTPFTVPVKVSTSWKLAVPLGWRIKVPCSVDVPLKVPVYATVALRSMIVFPPAERMLLKVAD